MKVFLLLMMFSFGSNVDTVDINIELVSKTVHITKSQGATIGVKVRINNNSKKNLLLYNFRSEPDQAFFEESFYCNGEIAARPSVIVYDKNMEPIHSRPQIPHEINYKQITDEVLEEAISAEKIKFRDALQVASAKSSTEVLLMVNFKEFHLEPGVYFMKVVYSSGTKSFNMISQDKVDEDKAKYDAEMFFGCIESSIIKVSVE